MSDVAHVAYMFDSFWPTGQANCAIAPSTDAPVTTTLFPDYDPTDLPEYPTDYPDYETLPTFPTLAPITEPPIAEPKSELSLGATAPYLERKVCLVPLRPVWSGRCSG